MQIFSNLGSKYDLTNNLGKCVKILLKNCNAKFLVRTIFNITLAHFHFNLMKVCANNLTNLVIFNLIKK